MCAVHLIRPSQPPLAQGQVRLDTPAQVAALNALYEQMWVYYNLFQPVLHLIAKGTNGTRITRKWDTAPPPLTRVLATNVLTDTQRATLEARVRATNPRALRHDIYQALRELLRADLPAGALAWAA